MINAMVPEKNTIHSQTEDPPRLIAQSRVFTLEIEPPEVVLPSLKPLTVYMHEAQKHRFISRILTDPEKQVATKNPLPATQRKMTFKEQLANEEAQRLADSEKKRKWDQFELDLKKREERANEMQKQAQKQMQEEKMRKMRQDRLDKQH